MNIKIYGDGKSRVAVRQITPQIYWLCHCLGECARDINGGFAGDFARVNPKLDPNASDITYSAFLFMDEKTLLVDTLSPGQRGTVIDALKDLLGTSRLDYLWISHIELPHAANTDIIRRTYPDVKLMTIGGSDHYQMRALEDAVHLQTGDIIDLGAHQIEMIKPLFVDHALTQWFFEHHSGFLFPVDWGLNAHIPRHCFMFMDEMEKTGYTAEQYMHEVSTTCRFIFPWLRWADPDQMAAAVEKLFSTYDVRIFAPSHTNVIRTDIAKYAAALQQAMRIAVTSEYDIVY